MLDKIAKTIKNIWFISATMITATLAVVAFIDDNNIVASNHDVEIGVSLFSVLFLSIFILYHLFKIKVNVVSSEIGLIKEAINELAIAQLKSDIRNFYDKHIGYETLRLHQAQSLHDLNNRRVQLGVNSMHERMLNDLDKKEIEDH